MRDRTQSRSQAKSARHEKNPKVVDGPGLAVDSDGGNLRRVPRVVGKAALEETVDQISPVPKHSPHVSRRFNPDALLGRQLGEYRIESILGRGSMACVYKAKHLGLHRPCALKVIDPALVMKQPVTREQFWAEARVAANLLHPNIVTIHNLGSADRISLHRNGIRPGRHDAA